MAVHGRAALKGRELRRLHARRLFLDGDQGDLIYSLSTLFQLILALAAALALKQKFVGFKPLWRGIMIISYAMPPVVVGAIWLFLLDPSLGMITHYLLEFGIIDSRSTGSPRTCGRSG